MKKIKFLILAGLMSLNLLPAASFVANAQIAPSDLLPSTISPQLGLGSTDIRVTIAKVIRVAMGLIGIVVVCIVIYGGFLWMTAGGNDEQVGTAKKLIIAAVIGLAIVLSAYAISTFVINQLVTATR